MPTTTADDRAFPEEFPAHTLRPARRGVYTRFFLKKEPLYTRDPGEGERQLTFLGTAGFVVAAAGHTIVLDPYLTRPSLRDTLFRPLVPDERLLRREIPVAHDVLVGHAHHDHALDAPAVARITGARVHGSTAVANLCRGYGLPEAQIHVVSAAEGAFACGPHRVTPLPSRHGKALLGRVPLPGDIPRPPPWPPRLRDLRHGDVHNWHLDLGGTSLVHVDSADFLDETFTGRDCDVLCLCAVGRQYRQDYTRRALELLRPRVVVPCHWDDFTLPHDAAPRQLPGVDVESFVEEIRAGGAAPVVLGLGQSWRF